MARGYRFRLTGELSRQRACQAIMGAPMGANAVIEPETRTLPQNAKMHAMLSDIALAKPMGRTLSPETWKCLLMDDLGFKPKWEPSLDGDGVVNTGYRSSRLTVAQMSDMIERMYAFGAEHGVEWSEPMQAA